MKCVRCKEAGGRTRDHIFPRRLLEKYGRTNRILGRVNIQRLCRPCHDIKEQLWREQEILIDYRSKDEQQELRELAGRFRLPVNFLVGCSGANEEGSEGPDQG